MGCSDFNFEQLLGDLSLIQKKRQADDDEIVEAEEAWSDTSTAWIALMPHVATDSSYACWQVSAARRTTATRTEIHTIRWQRWLNWKQRTLVFCAAVCYRHDCGWLDSDIRKPGQLVGDGKHYRQDLDTNWQEEGRVERLLVSVEQMTFIWLIGIRSLICVEPCRLTKLQV